jgi:hypothetical protein
MVFNCRRVCPEMQARREMNTKTEDKCKCSDPGCPVHKGESQCDNRAIAILYRIDMEDQSGTLMCETCAGDALESGVFREGLVLQDIADEIDWQNDPAEPNKRAVGAFLARERAFCEAR